KGCTVSLASHPDYRPKVESAGLTFLPYGISHDDYVQTLRLRPAEIVQRISSDHGFLIRRLIAPYLESSIRDIEVAIKDCDIVLGSPFAYGAHIASCLHGKPFTTVALQPTVMMSRYDPPKIKQAPFILSPQSKLAAAYNRLIMKTGEKFMAASHVEVMAIYRRYGLNPTIGLGGIVSDHQTIALYSKLLQDCQPDFPANTEIVGFPFHDCESGTTPTLPAHLEAFLDNGPAPLVFSLGTWVVYGGEMFYRRAVDVAKAIGERCVILVGGESPLLNVDFGPDVCVVAYAPHSLLFPRCKAVIHHGGIGSTAQALRAGKPQLVTPVFGDQFDNAFRLHKSGASLTLNYDKWRKSTAVKQIRELLANPAIAAQA
ncbi:MAG: glycosyltransferase family 1 protein, partial [Asticcacaulis sp.]|nr:glycosyltransferase family 1 protein [Asticcacaulis sp.]